MGVRGSLGSPAGCQTKQLQISALLALPASMGPMERSPRFFARPNFACICAVALPGIQVGNRFLVNVDLLEKQLEQESRLAVKKGDDKNENE